MLTVAAHDGDGVLKLLPLSICAVADTNVDRRLLAVDGFMFLCNEGGHVGHSEAREAAHHKNVSFLW